MTWKLSFKRYQRRRATDIQLPWIPNSWSLTLNAIIAHLFRLTRGHIQEFLRENEDIWRKPVEFLEERCDMVIAFLRKTICAEWFLIFCSLYIGNTSQVWIAVVTPREHSWAIHFSACLYDKERTDRTMSFDARLQRLTCVRQKHINGIMST